MFEHGSSESIIFSRACGELSHGLPADPGAVVYSQEFATALMTVRSRCAPNAPVVVGADSRTVAYMAVLSADDQAKVQRYIDLFNPKKEVK